MIVSEIWAIEGAVVRAYRGIYDAHLSRREHGRFERDAPDTPAAQMPARARREPRPKKP